MDALECHYLNWTRNMSFKMNCIYMLLRVTAVLIQNVVNAATANDLNISNVSQSILRFISDDIAIIS